MKTTRVLMLAVVSSVVWLGVSVSAALAQTPVDPSSTPLKNESATAPITPFGIHISLAALLLLLGLAMVLFLTIMYMRYAPRFSKDEESMKVVRADRVVVGQELPRRNVDLSQAAPVVVGPPAVPTALAAAAAPPAAIPAEPQALHAITDAPAVAAAEPIASPAAVAPTPQAAPASAPAPVAAPAAPAERVEVTMDQEVFDSTLQELLDAGTDRRIAEGKARRAGMIAAKKKAAGEA